MSNKPVAWMVNGKAYADIFEAEHYSKFTNKPMIPLYTTPQIKELSDEEIYEIGKQYLTQYEDGLYDFARAILKKASEK